MNEILDALKEWTRWIFGWLFIFLMVGLVIGMLPFDRDDSDGEWPHRSGLRIHIDALTGCQYLEVSNGGLTPRLNSQGRQVGCEK